MCVLIRFFLAIAIIISSVEAKIISTESMEAIERELSKVDSRTLVIFDYEDVLVGTIDNLFFMESAVIENNLYDYRNLLPKIVLANDLKVYNLMHDKWPSLIRGIQTLGARPILLTRGMKKIAFDDFENEFSKSISDARQTGLSSFNIDLRKSWAPLEKIEFSEIPITQHTSSNYCYNPFFINGMIFCGGYKKGPVLRAFLSRIPQIVITKIIFIDNKMQNLKSVEEAVLNLGIDFIGIEYTTSHIKKSYDADNKKMQKYWKNYMENILIINSFCHMFFLQHYSSLPHPMMALAQHERELPIA